MENARSRPAFGRIKHVLPEEAKFDALSNDRHRYSLLDFLQKRRGGGGASKPSVGLSVSSGAGSSSRLGGKPPAPKPGSVLPVSSPSKPKLGPLTGGTSPSKPKSPVGAPPKAPKLPKLPELPKPKSGWKPPKGWLPGYKPGYPPYHGSGGHTSVIGGGQHQGNNRPSSTHSCIHPKGFERLRCEKADAIVGTIFVILGLILAPFLIYLCIRYCKRRKSIRKGGHEEDGVELTGGVLNCDPGPQINREVLNSPSNIGLAVTTSEETFKLAKEHPDDRSFDSSPGRKPSLVRQSRATNSSRGRRISQVFLPRSSLSRERRISQLCLPRSSLSRGRTPFRRGSLASVASSLSSGMIRTAILGQALQDPTIIDVPPSLASSRKNSERMCSGSDADISSDCSPSEDGERHSQDDGGRDRIDDNSEGNNRHEGAESRSRSSSRRSSLRDTGDQPESNAVSPGDSASKSSVSSPSSPSLRNSEDKVDPSLNGEIFELDTDAQHRA